MLSGEFFLQTSLLSAMLGASIGFCIEEGFSHPTTFRIIAIVALILHLVNFYHAKVGRLYDRTEQLSASARPYVHVSIIFSNILLFATFCVMALRIVTIAAITLGEVVIRIIDIVTVAAQLRVGDRSPGRASIDRAYARQLRYWQYMNVITLVVFAAVFVAGQFLPYRIGYPLAASVLALLVTIDLIIEYGVFARNYFQGLDDWDRLAERWDQLQGEYGDPLRVSIIHPFVVNWVTRRAGPREDAVVIDVGCGNGCTSRALGRTGYLTVAFDKATRLVEIGKLYPDSGTHYLVADVDKIDSIASVQATTLATGKQRRAAIGLFSLQDCDDLSAAFVALATMLRADEYLLIIYETEAGFQPAGMHTTTARSWKYSRSGERKQVVSWLPVTEPNPTSVCADMRDDANLLITTMTNFRTLDDYRLAGLACGLTLVDSGLLRYGGRPSTLADLRYEQEPKFAFAEFARVVDVPAQHPAGREVAPAEGTV
jgi:hypothetical protein